jgi:hypothetical protein
MGVTSTIGKIAARMATIGAAMPVLMEVQGHLARVPDTLGQLGDNVDTLQVSIDPLSRVVQRLPGGGSRD